MAYSIEFYFQKTQSTHRTNGLMTCIYMAHRRNIQYLICLCEHQQRCLYIYLIWSSCLSHYNCWTFSTEDRPIAKSVYLLFNKIDHNMIKIHGIYLLEFCIKVIINIFNNEQISTMYLKLHYNMFSVCLWYVVSV